MLITPSDLSVSWNATSSFIEKPRRLASWVHVTSSSAGPGSNDAAA
jgi:hypothetical protein